VTGDTIRRHAGVAGDRGGLRPHGTLSLRQALDDLGFGPTYHGEDLRHHWSHVTKWHRFATTGHTDWDDLFASYGSESRPARVAVGGASAWSTGSRTRGLVGCASGARRHGPGQR